jgi:alkyldihydroxyacetonephosphate synthase
VIGLDRPSLLAHVRGEELLGVVERALEAEGLTLGLGGDAPTDATFAAWIAAGAPGAPLPWLDPADHLVAGFSAKLPDGRVLEVRPAPRRSVGPDFFALVFGRGDRALPLLSLHVRVHIRGARRPAAPLRWAGDAPPSEAEAVLWAAVERELQR